MNIEKLNKIAAQNTKLGEQVRIGLRNGLNAIAEYDEARDREPYGLSGIVTLGYTNALSEGRGLEVLGRVLAVLLCSGTTELKLSVVRHVRDGQQLMLGRSGKKWFAAE